VLLVVLTPESRAALGAPQAEIERFPYRVGRESRGLQLMSAGFVRKRRSPGSRPTNDLYLVEDDEPMNVSRTHLQIDCDDAGYVLVDRASTCGTIVEGQIVGGGTPGRHYGAARRRRDHRRDVEQSVRLQVPGRLTTGVSSPVRRS
jgi:pSer/pThr/pTyr-binding forkhead associated (FHA) protein